MRDYRRNLWALLAVAMIVLLTACTNTETENESEPMYLVSFTCDAGTVNRQVVVDGHRASVPEPAIHGYYLHHWENEEQQMADPGKVAISQDTNFYGVLYPDFQDMAAYLFPDSNGWLHPEDVLTCSQLKAAFAALAPVEAPQTVTDFLDNLSEGEDEPVTKETLTAIYRNPKLFPPEQGAAALEVLPEGEVTRDAFARSICLLLNRDWENQPVKVVEKQSVPLDIDPGDASTGYLLDSCMEHTAGRETDGNIQNAMLHMSWEPGFHLQKGILYCANEEGELLREESLGNLYFGEDGRYVSGDPELDEIVEKLIFQFQQENEGADRYTLLYAAFVHVRDNMRYIRREKLAFRETDWANRLGKEALTTYKGNCFHYAAAFTVLARGLGYDAREISGQGFEPLMPHGWVEIYIDGEQLFFDPQTAAKEVVYHGRGNWGEDMFAIPMYKKDWWRYTW